MKGTTVDITEHQKRIYNAIIKGEYPKLVTTNREAYSNLARLWEIIMDAEREGKDWREITVRYFDGDMNPHDCLLPEYLGSCYGFRSLLHSPKHREQIMEENQTTPKEYSCYIRSTADNGWHIEIKHSTGFEVTIHAPIHMHFTRMTEIIQQALKTIYPKADQPPPKRGHGFNAQNPISD